MLRIYLLGEQRIAGRSDSAGVRHGTRSLDLLAYLILHAGTVLSRGTLAGVFWPDSGQGQARTNLRRELHHLRRLLGDDVSVLGDGPDLSWRNSGSCRVDALVFGREYDAGRAAGERGDRAALLRHAQAAVDEYRGDLLPGNDEQWVLEQREQLRRQCVELCDLAAAAWADGGEPARALVRRRIELEPLSEIGHRTLMELQIAAGDTAAALTSYHRCAALFDRELGVRPTEQMQLIYRGLTGPGPALPGPPRPARPAAPGRVLVGREAELAQLRHQWDEAAAGRAGMLLIRGEPGVGKTRLLAALAGTARRQGAAVAVARCFGHSGRVALGPVAEWLGNVAFVPALASLEAHWRAEVHRLVPQSGAVAADAGLEGRAMVDSWQRHRFFEGLSRAVLGPERPTLLVLDDLQWCDTQTLAWLDFVLNFAPHAHLLIAAAARSVDLQENHELSVGLRKIAEHRLLREINAPPLGADATIRLAAAVARRPISAPEAHILHAAAGGYPLFIIEAARTLPAAGTTADPADMGDLREVLGRRLDQLSSPAAEAAGLAAAIGRNFSLELLWAAGDPDHEELVRAVDELWRRGILQELHGGYDFAHDLLRQAAYARLTPARRWLLHGRIAHALERLHAERPEEVAAQLAEQYRRGGRPEDAARYFSLAAAEAARVFAHAEALDHDRRALELIGSLPENRDRDRRELEVLQVMAAPLLALQGYSSPELEVRLDRTVELAQRLDVTEVEVTALIGLFAARFVQGRTRLSLQIAERALTLSAAVPDLSGSAHFAVAGASLSLGRPDTAIVGFDRAIDLSLDAYSFILGTKLEVHCRSWASHAHWLVSRDDEALELSDDAVARGRASGHPYSLAVALAYGAVLRQLTGDRDGLGAAVAELDQLCGRYAFTYYRQWAQILAGWLEGGDRGQARIQEGIGALRGEQALTRMPYWLYLLGDARIAAGNTDAGAAVLASATVVAEQNEDRWFMPYLLARRAELESGAKGESLAREAAAMARAQHSRPPGGAGAAPGLRTDTRTHTRTVRERRPS